MLFTPPEEITRATTSTVVAAAVVVVVTHLAREGEGGGRAYEETDAARTPASGPRSVFRLHVARPRRREGWERKGVHRGTRHLRTAEAKKGMLLRGNPDASPTPDKAQARHHPWPAPNCPHPHAPQDFFINGFFIVARSFSNWPTPRPPGFLHQRFIHRRALVGRSKPL